LIAQGYDADEVFNYRNRILQYAGNSVTNCIDHKSYKRSSGFVRTNMPTLQHFNVPLGGYIIYTTDGARTITPQEFITKFLQPNGGNIKLALEAYSAALAMRKQHYQALQQECIGTEDTMSLRERKGEFSDGFLARPDRDHATIVVQRAPTRYIL